MQYTTNYSLSQYDATDRVTRSTFNSDNSKIDTAIKNAANAAATAQSTATAAQSAANNKTQLVFGTYNGTGDAISQTISLGFRPSAVFIFSGMPDEANAPKLLFLPDAPISYVSGTYHVTSEAYITSNGFFVRGMPNSSNFGTFYYCAVK